MAIIQPPETIPLRSIEWQLRQPAQINRSGWTGRRQVIGLPGGGMWSGSAELVPIVTETNVRKWRAFFAALRGPVNSFYLPATETDQHAHSAIITVDGAGQTGFTLATTGWSPSTLALPAGSMIRIAGTNQMVMLTTDALADAAGKTTLNFVPNLRMSPANGALVHTKRPSALVSLSSDVSGWTVSAGQLYALSFAFEEVF